MENYKKDEVFSQVYPVPILKENTNALKPLNPPFSTSRLTHFYSIQHGNQYDTFQQKLNDKSSFYSSFHSSSFSYPRNYKFPSHKLQNK